MFRTLGACGQDWEYLRLWMGDADGNNFTPAFGRLLEFVRTFAPGGQSIQKPRDAKGRFVPTGGTSKTSLFKAKKRRKEQDSCG